jgi:predicted ArsR family transcriptional regulator
MASSSEPDPIASIGALAEPTRRALYAFVAARPEPSSREAAAAALDVPLHSVKFHLDRLVDDGLLEVEYRRLSGRTGPGAGRPSKLYRRSAREVSVSLPPREYDLAGNVLAAGIERSAASGEPVAEAVGACARAAGTQIGETATSRATGLRRLAAALRPHGYEPSVTGTDMVLENCPFDRLAKDHRALVCAMNLHLVEGTIEGAGCVGVDARLDPADGRCCVTAHARK